MGWRNRFYSIRVFCVGNEHFLTNWSHHKAIDTRPLMKKKRPFSAASLYVLISVLAYLTVANRFNLTVTVQHLLLLLLSSSILPKTFFHANLLTQYQVGGYLLTFFLHNWSMIRQTVCTTYCTTYEINNLWSQEMFVLNLLFLLLSPILSKTFSHANLLTQC